MTELQQHWYEVLTLVFERAESDAAYRELCKSDPVAAVKAVTAYEVPDDLNVRFVETPKEFVHNYELPPMSGAGPVDKDKINALIRWATICTTLPTTN